MAPNLKVDIEWLKKDAKQWADSAATVGGFAQGAANSKIYSPFGSPPVGEMAYDPYNLIRDFLDAYNKFCDTFHDRAQAGEKALNAMSTTLVSVANAYEAQDTPR